VLVWIHTGDVLGAVKVAKSILFNPIARRAVEASLKRVDTLHWCSMVADVVEPYELIPVHSHA